MLEIAKKAEHKKYYQLFSQVDKMISDELENADKKFGGFNSCHEGISVLLEEIEEAESVLKTIKKQYDNAWEGVKANDFTSQLPIVSKLYLKSLYMVMEGVQVAAMAEKYYAYLQANNPQIAMPGQMSIGQTGPDK